MYIVISILICGIALLVAAPSVHAIIFLPAALLIPVAKIIAIVIGSFSLPAFGIGTVWGKMTGKSLKRILLVIATVLLVLAVILGVTLKLIHPDRPLF